MKREYITLYIHIMPLAIIISGLRTRSSNKINNKMHSVVHIFVGSSQHLSWYIATLGCSYNVVKYGMLLHTSQPLSKQKINQSVSPQQTLHSSR